MPPLAGVRVGLDHEAWAKATTTTNSSLSKGAADPVPKVLVVARWEIRE